ncbi:DoxX family protein [Candidatus Uhrbacteria bacterium]|nr:DoxX family protein [Candidatus Uhrbacteria bacterium]
MNELFLLGRVLFGGFFIYNAVQHLTKIGSLAGYAASRGVPMPKAAVIVSGLLLLAGGLGVLFGRYVDFAIVALVLFLVPVTLQMHSFWKDTDPNVKMSNQINFMKNLALTGGALTLAGVPQPWVYALPL